MAYDPRFVRGILEFNRGDFFEAHERIEAYWHEVSGPHREFVQAVIQAAVCLHHLVSGNRVGAEKVRASCGRHFGAFRPRHGGIDVDGLLAGIDAAMAAPVVDARALPVIDLDPPPTVEEASAAAALEEEVL